MATPPTCLSVRFSGFFLWAATQRRLGAYQICLGSWSNPAWFRTVFTRSHQDMSPIPSGLGTKKNCGGQSKIPPYLVVDDFFHGKIRISCQNFRYQQSPPNAGKNGTRKHPFLVSEISVKSPILVDFWGYPLDFCDSWHQGTAAPFLRQFLRLGPQSWARQQNLRILGMLIVQNDWWWMMIDDVWCI